jgi:hypothetical protein
MTRLGEEVGTLEHWYSSQVRPFLAREEPSRLEEFDADLDRLRGVRDSLCGELAVCFLGTSGVGKSTLINALVAGREMVLPSGGIGPLTAQALTVRRGEVPGFEVHYHPPGQLGKVLFALERTIEVRQKERASSSGWTPDGNPEAPVVEAATEAEEEIKETVLGDDASSRGKVAEYIKQAQLMVTGSQDAQEELPYLADCLRAALGRTRIWDSPLRREDEPRLLKIRSALSLAQAGQPYRRTVLTGEGDFSSDLRDHASGFLAPLIRQLEVAWNSDALSEDIVLVDLPGVGIANDVFRNVTHEWIRERARAVVLVVGKSGVTEPDAQLLRASGFLNRLLYSVDNPSEDPVLLMIAVVRVDDSAETRWAEERAQGRQGRKKREYFAEVCAEAVTTIRNQMRQQLEQVWASGGIGEGQSRVIDHLVERLEIHPLSAIEYRRCLVNDEEDHSFLIDPDQSNVPRLLESLRQQARARRHEEATRIQEACENFSSKLLRGFEVIRAQWLEENRAVQEAERLREEFLVFLAPLREEFLRRQGAFRNFLRATLPEVITGLVAKAREEARREIAAYLDELNVTHWKTLQAAVRRGGIYYGSKHIELPKDFALRFEVPIAEVWGKEILKKIRSETTQYAKVCVQLVEEVVTWAQQQGARFQTRLVEAQRDAIKADVKNLESIGRAMVNELREQVNRRLVKGIEGPIRKRCQQFVAENQHVGAGAKGRMLSLFRDLADHVTREASGTAIEILQGCFREVEQEILVVFAQHQDPLESARQAIVSSHEQWKRRSDAQRKRRVLEEIESIMTGPPHAETGESMHLAEAVV